MSLLDRLVSLSLPLVPKPVVRAVSRRYIAGTRMEDAFRVIRSLRAEGAMATLDILGEFVTRREEAEANTRAYQELVQRIRDEGLDETNVSVKLTALGLLLDPAICLENMRRLMRTVADTDNFARIDMEDSRCTSATLEIYETLRREFPRRVGVVIQAYLRRSLDDVERLTREPSNFRICKGIYVEPREIAYKDREIVRRNFTHLLERMIQRQAYVGIATHDELLTWEGERLVREYGLPNLAYEFQMLLGVEEALRRILIRRGHRLRVYVPYGEHWYGYSLRRLRENPQIAGYVFKAMLRRR